MSSLLALGGIAGLVPRYVPERADLDVATTRTKTSKRLSWMRSKREIAKRTPGHLVSTSALFVVLAFCSCA